MPTKPSGELLSSVSVNRPKYLEGVHYRGAEFVTEVLSGEKVRDYKQPSIWL